MSKLTIAGIENEITNRIADIAAEIEIIQRLKTVGAKDDTTLLGQINSLMCKNAARVELQNLLAKIRMNSTDKKGGAK